MFAIENNKLIIKYPSLIPLAIRKEYWYNDDVEGGMNVRCMWCAKDFFLPSKTHYTKVYCVFCKEHLNYPDGASW